MSTDVQLSDDWADAALKLIKYFADRVSLVSDWVCLKFTGSYADYNT